ncbi:transporter substrate-binding domain-containing protein [Cryobacterium sp. TMT1-21]|uniref:Transporter substrate-binding domain-containing protein n=1 Tax=Cryobacterium shii TaxID=1259235 RepID=A0AAQ2HF60_9MICO|nr:MULTISPECIES: transporter substrate-binding domain-containing protein [Cryobacterium]TFC44686.1 transporter substrate-binding domain-containing protein [Cryobacterium shii]TFD14584.1 transporter substrate-binding domain-containing protein [Cryobacterium sp. TMT1-21]TFD41668.1 transporter substrate-binding domain-containing protein [Cryobacterium sp. TMT2-10]
MTKRHQLSAMHRRILGATMAATLLVSLSACAPTAAGADAASAADKPKSVSVVASGKLTCAMSGEYRPFNFYDESNKLVGFDVDVCTAVAKELGLEAAPVTGAFNTLIAGLVGNRYDAIIGSMASTDERKKEVDFSDPYYSTGAQLFVAKGSSIKDVTGLKDAKVGVALGTTFEEFAHGLDGVGEVKTYQADIDALRDLEAGRVDAVITQGFMGRFLAKSAGLKAEAVGDVLFPDVASIPVSKDNPKLLSAINAALKTMHDDGTYKKISMKWFATDIS